MFIVDVDKVVTLVMKCLVWTKCKSNPYTHVCVIVEVSADSCKVIAWLYIGGKSTCRQVLMTHYIMVFRASLIASNAEHS